MSQPNSPAKKPILRGYFHQEAFFTFLGACTLLMIGSTSQQKLLSSAIFSFGLLFLFGVSAIYHRPHWQPKPRALLKRFDHSAIFILIASTFTPFCLLALPEPGGEQLLIRVWIAAILGVIQSIFWVKAPKWLTAVLYVAMGWLIAPYISELNQSLGPTNVALIIAGGVVYTVGAVFYALRKPVMFPRVFGYHELFHLFTLIGASFHFAVIYQLTR
jgi:hemolysin III